MALILCPEILLQVLIAVRMNVSHSSATIWTDGRKENIILTLIMGIFFFLINN